MEKYIVLIILAVVFYYLHNCWVENKIEKFLNSRKIIENFGDAVTVDGVDDKNAINTLARIATQLNSKEGLTVPGKLNFVNSKQIGSGIQMDDDNYLRIKNKDGGQMMAISDNGTTYFGPSGKDDGPVKCGAFTSQNVTVNGAGSIQNPNGTLRMNNQGIMFGGPNNGKEVNSAQIAAGLHQANSLNIVGMSSGAGHQDRRVDVWAEGGFNINGSLIVNGRNIINEIEAIKQNGIFINQNVSARPIHDAGRCFDFGSQGRTGCDNGWSIVKFEKR